MPCTIAAEARRILAEHLQANTSLQLPSNVTNRLATVQFTPETVTPSVPTPAKLSESSAALWALLGVFSAVIAEERYGLPQQDVTVDVHSATLFPLSALIARIDGKGVWDPEVKCRVGYLDHGYIGETYRSLASNIYETQDHRFFQLHGSLDATNTLTMLGLPQHRPDLSDAAAVKDVYRQAVGQHTAAWLDVEANEFWRQPGTICYTKDEFRNHTAHGRASWDEPLYSIDAVTDVLTLPAVPWPTMTNALNRPLTGIKVLDLTRVIAGPTISKILALQGADVLRVSSRSIPEASILMFDTQIGKRDVEIDLKTRPGKLAFRALLEEADVILDGFRPGVLERLGFGRTMVQEMARRRGKGIVYARENTYGWRGEWQDRCGYQQISDCVTGVSWAQGQFLGLEEPVVPLLPNSDYQTGIVGAIGISHALDRRSREGGSYNVDTSLNQFNNWYLDLGLQDEETLAAIKSRHPDFLVRHDTDLFTMISLTRESLHNSHGSGKGELFDPARFTTMDMRWGREREMAEFLDWTQIVRFSGPSDQNRVRYGYDHGSHMPGADTPEWFQT